MLYVEENLPAAFQAFEEALEISEEVKDIFTSFLVSFWFGSNLTLNCEFERATHYMQKALDISIAGGNLWGIAAMKANFAHSCYFLPGRITLGFQTSAEAVRIAEESGDSLSKGIAYTHHGTLCYGRGFFEEAEKYFLKGTSCCEKVNERFINLGAHFYLGEVYFNNGDFSRSEEWFGKGFRLAKDSRYLPSFAGQMKVGLIRAKGMIDPKDIDLESLYAIFKK